MARELADLLGEPGHTRREPASTVARAVGRLHQILYRGEVHRRFLPTVCVDPRSDAKLARDTEESAMRIEDMILVSIDDHVIEPRDMFERHVPEKYKDDAPKVVKKDAFSSQAAEWVGGWPGRGVK